LIFAGESVKSFKSNTMKNILLTSFICLLVNSVSAQNDPDAIVKTFFDLAGAGKYQQAIEAMPSTHKCESDTSYSTKLLSRLEMIGENAGEYCGYELVEKEEVSPSYITCTYFMKFMNAPHQIVFTFYKPKDTWQVININITGQARRGGQPAKRPAGKK